MDDSTDLRRRVVLQLQARVGELRTVAEAVGLSYDTVLRIKNEEGDPGYSKVATLARHFFPDEFPVTRAAAAAPAPAPAAA